MRPAAGRQHARRPFHLSHALLLMAAFVVGNARPAVAQAPWTWAGYFELVASPGGPPDAPIAADGANRASRHPLSQDGRFVVFDTDATNLGAPDGVSAIYRRDRITGTLTLVQTGYVRNAAISADGLHVAYEQCAPGFASPCQIYARDLRTAMSTPTLVSSTVPGVAGNGDSFTPTLSLNGRYAVYVTNAQNLSNDALRRKQIIWRDRDLNGDGIYDQVGAVGVQTITVNGAQFGNGDSDTPEVSDDGRLVAFRSAASNLVTGDTNALVDVFLRDRALSTTRRLNLRPGNVQSPFPIAEPHISMSGNGQFVAFASADPVLTSSVADSNATLDVFLYQGTTTLLRVDVGRNGSFAVPGNGPTGWATLNTDGRYLSLQSAATNAPFLSPTGTVQVYAVDRQFQTVTRISGMPDGAEPDAPSVQPSITAGGSLVTFSSSATTFTGMAAPAFAQIHAAARLNVTPETVTLPATGGQATIRISAHTYTRLQPWLDPDGAWLTTSLALNPPELNMLAVNAPQNDGAERSTIVHVGTRTVTVTQPALLTITSVWPNVGPMSGGNTVTITGTGFGPDALVFFGEQQVATQFVDTSTIVVTAPSWPAAEQVTLRVEFDPWNRAWAMDGYTFVWGDATPPSLAGVATGPQGQDGWFVGDVTVSWTMGDGESPISSTTCTTIVVNADTPGTTYECTATSAGGTTSASVFVKRDTAPPLLTVTSPTAQQRIPLAASIASSYVCTDATSGVAECGGAAPSGAALDTQTPGWHTFAASATDRAGNTTTVTREYVVSSGTCQAPLAGLADWIRFQDDLRDSTVHLQYGSLSNMDYSFADGPVGRAFFFPTRPYGFMDQYHGGALDFSDAMSAAFWIAPESTGLATLLENAQQFRIDREPDGAIRWTVYGPDRSVEGTGLSTTRAPLNTWSHVAFTYAAGEVKLYVNGRLDGAWMLSTTTLNAVPAPSGDWLMVGAKGPWSATNYYVGGFDELQMFGRALEPGEIEAMFLTLESGTCPPVATVFDIPDITVPYGAGTLPIRVTLRTVDGRPVAGKTIRIFDTVVQSPNPYLTLTAVTDENGEVRWDAPFNVAPGVYQMSVWASSYPDDVHYLTATMDLARVTVTALPTQVTWNAPAPVTYGTALGAGQLNATADVAGGFLYTPTWYTVLGAGSHVLSTTFTPSSVGHATVTANVTLEVRKAIPVMSVTGGSFTFNGQARSAIASVRDYRGIALTPVVLTYNGTPNVPVAPGVYAVEASFAGDANHEARTVVTTLTITKATPTVVFSSPATFAYDALPHGLTATVTGIGGAALGTVPVTYDGTATAPVNAGTYTATATFAGETNYESRSVSTSLTISPATPVVTVTGGAFTFDGEPHAATVAVSGVGTETPVGAVTVTYNGSSTVPTGAGSYAVNASVAAAGNYAAASGTATLTISKAAAALSLTGGTFVYDGQPHAAVATITGANAAPLSPVTITYNGAATVPVHAGTYAVEASFAGDANHQPASTATTLVIAKAATTLAWDAPAPVAYGTPLSAAQLNATASVGGTFTYSPAAGTVLETGPAHTLSATFTPADPVNYEGGTVSTTIAVQRAIPTISVTGGAFTYDGQPHPAAAAVTGGGGAALAPVAVTYNGATAVPIDAGSYTVEVTFPGDANHAPASASGTLTIASAAAALSWSAPASVTYGTPLSSTQLNATASVPGTFVYTPAAGTLLGVGAGHVVTATFTPTDAQNFQTGGTVSIAITVERAAAAVSVGGGAFAYDGQPHAAAASAVGVGGVSLTPVSLTYNGSAAVPVDAGTYHVVGTFAGDENHAPASASGTLTIVRATAALSWSEPASVTYGTPLGAAQLNATASVPGAITYAPGPGAVLAGGAHTLTATFAPADAQNYASATVSTTLVVERATPSLSVMGGAFTYDGQPHAASTSGSGIDGTALTPIATTYNGAAAAPVSAGTYDVVATFAGDANHAPATATATITIDRAAAVLSWNAPAAITYGALLDAARLNATASVSGSFSYSPAAGTRLNGGTHTLTATFTPADAQNYATATVTTTIVVERKVPSLGLQFANVTYDGQPHAAEAVARGADWELLEPLIVTYNGSTTVPVDAGVYEITSSFAGDDNHAPKSVTTTGEIRRAPVPSMSWGGGGMLVYGMPLTAPYLQATASVPGTFSYSPGLGAVLPAGQQTVTATFTPDSSNYLPATFSRWYMVERKLVSVNANDAGKVYGAGLPVFAVSFFGLVNGDTPASLGGALAFTTSATASSPVGTYAVTPTGLSSPNYTMHYVSGTLSIVKAPVALTLTASPTPSGLDMPITFSATVAAAQAAPTAPAGTVRFFDGATLLGTETLSGGTATLLGGGLSAGSHTIEARYDGDASFDIGTHTATHVVNTAASTPAITLTTSRQPASTGQSMTFTATITVATTGTIAFYDGGTLLGSGSIAAGRATLTVASLAASSHAITARFQGTASAPPVISPVLVQSVTGGGSWKDRTSSVALGSSANPSALGTTVTFTATASGSSGTPTGRILFLVDGLVVGDPTGVAMSGSGQASVSVATLNGGRHKVTATYLGNSNYRGSNGALTQTVN